MPQLLGNNADVDMLFSEFAGVCVSQAVGVNALFDAGLGSQTLEGISDVGSLKGRTVQRGNVKEASLFNG